MFRINSLVFISSYASYIGPKFSFLGLIVIIGIIFKLLKNKNKIFYSDLFLYFLYSLIILSSIFIAITDKTYPIEYSESKTLYFFMYELIYPFFFILILSYSKNIKSNDIIKEIKLVSKIHIFLFFISQFYILLTGENINAISSRSISFLDSWTATAGIFFNPNYFALTSVILLGVNLFFSKKINSLIILLTLTCICSGSRIAELSTFILLMGYIFPYSKSWIFIGLISSIFLAYNIYHNFHEFVALFDKRYEVWDFLLSKEHLIFSNFDFIINHLEKNNISIGTQNTFLLYFLKYGIVGLIFYVSFLIFKFYYGFKKITNNKEKSVFLALIFCLVLNSFVRNHMLGGVGFISFMFVFALIALPNNCSKKRTLNEKHNY